MAVRRRLGNQVGAEDAAGTSAVLHQERLLERARHALRGEAGDRVGVAAGREGHDNAHRLGRPGSRGLRPGGAGMRAKQDQHADHGCKRHGKSPRRSGGQTVA